MQEICINDNSDAVFCNSYSLKSSKYYWHLVLTSWCETVSFFTCFLGLGVCMFGTGGESGTTGRQKEEETFIMHVCVCIKRRKESTRGGKRNSECYQLAFVCQRAILIFYSTLCPEGEPISLFLFILGHRAPHLDWFKSAKHDLSLFSPCFPPLSLSYPHHHCCLAGASLSAVSSSAGSPLAHHRCPQPQDVLFYCEKQITFDYNPHPSKLYQWVVGLLYPAKLYHVQNFTHFKD